VFIDNSKYDNEKSFCCQYRDLDRILCERNVVTAFNAGINRDGQSFCPHSRLKTRSPLNEHRDVRLTPKTIALRRIYEKAEKLASKSGGSDLIPIYRPAAVNSTSITVNITVLVGGRPVPSVPVELRIAPGVDAAVRV